MKIQAPEDLSTLSLDALRDVAVQARELDIAAQVELRARAESQAALRQEVRFENVHPTARKVIQFLEGDKRKRGGKLTMLWMAACFVALLNAKACVNFVADFVDRVDAANGAMKAQE